MLFAPGLGGWRLKAGDIRVDARLGDLLDTGVLRGEFSVEEGLARAAGPVRVGQYARVPEYDAVLREHCGLTVACLAGREKRVR